MMEFVNGKDDIPYNMENMNIPLVGGVQNPSIIPVYWCIGISLLD